MNFDRLLFQNNFGYVLICLVVVDVCWFRDPQLIKKIGAITALEVKATGIAQAFAPCVAVINQAYKKKKNCSYRRKYIF